MPLDLDFEQHFIRVTERAAVAAAKTMGYGDRKHSDHVAVEARRDVLDTVEIAGRVVIGEGERDKAPMLYVGEELGRRDDEERRYLPEIDIAVDPLEGTHLCATGGHPAARPMRPRLRTAHDEAGTGRGRSSETSTSPPSARYLLCDVS